MEKATRKYFVLISFLILGFVGHTQSQYEVIVVDRGHKSFGPEEPSIAIHPNNPKKLVAGANINKLYQSENGGKTWEKIEVSSLYGIWGDPVVIPGPNGYFFYFHLSFSNPGAKSRESWLDRMVCQTSSDFGGTWTDGTFTGFNPPKDQDKEWAAFDPISNYLYLTWTEFDEYNNDDPEYRTRARFSMSKDLGKTWSEAITISNKTGICLDDSRTLEGVVPAVDSKGHVNVVWMLNDSIYFNKSTDYGKTWLKKERGIHFTTGWEFKVPGVNRCNGMPNLSIHKKDEVETMYLTWSDQSSGDDNTNVWLSTSTDGGSTWSAKKLVNDKREKGHQFFHSMALDQKTGFLYWIYYDRSEHEDLNTDLIITWSEDGGQSFHHSKVSKTSFKGEEDVFFGDYIQVVAHKGNIRPIWTSLEGDDLVLKVALIKHKELVAE